jgi:putative transposase
VLLLTEGQMNDHMGARLLLPTLPRARELLADRGYDSDRFRAELAERGIAPCIPSIPSRKVPLPYDRTLYRQRHRIENAFGRLKLDLNTGFGKRGLFQRSTRTYVALSTTSGAVRAG